MSWSPGDDRDPPTCRGCRAEWRLCDDCGRPGMTTPSAAYEASELMMPDPRSIWGEVQRERDRAHRKHGDTSMEALPVDDLTRLTVLTEEVGEVAREFNEARHNGALGSAMTIQDTLADCVTSFGISEELAQGIAAFIVGPASGLRVTAAPRFTIGSICITKYLDGEGRVQVNVEHDGMTIYEVVGLLMAEVDTQRADIQESRRER